MKRLSKLLVALILAAGFSAAFAAHDPQLAEKMRICFEKHGQIMEKPSIKNLQDCYRVHGYLMKK